MFKQYIFVREDDLQKPKHVARYTKNSCLIIAGDRRKNIELFESGLLCHFLAFPYISLYSLVCCV
jgi:hypothetical protein